jgi:lipoprotein-anchoring transpeptidase ErfK/SrfK
MKTNAALPPEILRACSRQAVVPTRFILAVSIAAQTTSLFERNGARHTNATAALAPVPARAYRLLRTFRCSTSKFGIGETAGSNKTPRGLHRIAEKFGGGWPVGTVFEGRKMVGFTWSGRPFAPIASRLFWLEGLEPGFNRGGCVDSHRRYIYIHGVGNETTLGRPDSHGCIHLAADDLIPLYDKLPAATLVWISER